jgi:chloramphenicol 3-O phosphotransferase
MATAGSIILVNGASSAGKSTLCRALQDALELPFWHYSIDHFRGTGVLPWKRIDQGDFAWTALRPAFFDGFHRCLPALASAGNHLIVEHIVETKAWMRDLVALLSPFDVFFIGVHCPLDELVRREAARGDRPLGDARRDFQTVHTFGTYDLEIDATRPIEENVALSIAAWRARIRPHAFDRMAAA